MFLKRKRKTTALPKKKFTYSWLFSNSLLFKNETNAWLGLELGFFSFALPGKVINCTVLQLKPKHAGLKPGWMEETFLLIIQLRQVNTAGARCWKSIASIGSTPLDTLEIVGYHRHLPGCAGACMQNLAGHFEWKESGVLILWRRGGHAHHHLCSSSHPRFANSMKVTHQAQLNQQVFSVQSEFKFPLMSYTGAAETLFSRFSQ